MDWMDGARVGEMDCLKLMRKQGADMSQSPIADSTMRLVCPLWRVAWQTGLSEFALGRRPQHGAAPAVVCMSATRSVRVANVDMQVDLHSSRAILC